MKNAIITSQNVSVIPATRYSVQNGGQMKTQKNIRVAAYCRVSTGDESQQTSYTGQKAFYYNLICRTEGWNYAGIYADEAITGTSRVHRQEFNRMIEDAMDGKLDYIITKSISRFARNTVDTLNCVRQLKQKDPPVGIYFEKENIDTLDAAGELILTILSALAQEESRSISDNIRWSFQKRFQAGIPQINLNRMIGYDWGPDGEWQINPKQAEIVRFIFERFLYGKSGHSIAEELNKAGKKTINGNDWRADTIYGILRNEKFVGDLEMQKTYTKSFLTHQSVPNTGEVPKYYIKDHHPGIIERITWNRTQAILKEREQSFQQKQNHTGYAVGHKKRGARPSVFYNLRCGSGRSGTICGEPLFRMTYSGSSHGAYRYSYPVWRCQRKRSERSGTRTPHHSACSLGTIYECAIEQSFMELLYRIKYDYEKKKEKSHLIRLFTEACEKRNKKQDKLSPCFQTELLSLQIQELKEMLEVSREEAEIQKLRSELNNLTNERLLLETETDSQYEKNFQFFLEYLLQLPDKNPAGMKLNVYGIDTENSDQSPPDFLHFEKGIYTIFIKKGIVYGDEIEYQTNFGVKFISTGNQRTLNSFLGFRRCNPDGTIEILDQPWKVNNRKIQRKEGKAKEQ